MIPARRGFAQSTEDLLAEKSKDSPGPADVSRRGLIKQVGLAGVGAAISSPNVAPAAAAEAPPAPRREALDTLNATEPDTLDAIVARLIPPDENGPGATEARPPFYNHHG